MDAEPSLKRSRACPARSSLWRARSRVRARTSARVGQVGGVADARSHRPAERTTICASAQEWCRFRSTRTPGLLAAFRRSTILIEKSRGERHAHRHARRWCPENFCCMTKVCLGPGLASSISCHGKPLRAVGGQKQRRQGRAPSRFEPGHFGRLPADRCWRAVTNGSRLHHFAVGHRAKSRCRRHKKSDRRRCKTGAEPFHLPTLTGLEVLCRGHVDGQAQSECCVRGKPLKRPANQLCAKPSRAGAINNSLPLTADCSLKLKPSPSCNCGRRRRARQHYPTGEREQRKSAAQSGKRITIGSPDGFNPSANRLMLHIRRAGASRAESNLFFGRRLANLKPGLIRAVNLAKAGFPIGRRRPMRAALRRACRP